ncbi:aromatic ring-hydroxylating oxygenase subunit alpha [Pseudomonas sp. GW6]
MALHTFITQQQIDDVRRPLAEASYLPPKLYHDPAFYDFEVEHVFMRTWLPVAHVSELPEANCYLARDMFNEPILLTRNEEGVIQAFSNVCRHRTARIAHGAGKFDERTNLVSCPYHGWGYSPNGELMATPMMHKTANFERRKCGLPKIATEVWQGFIFVNFADAAEPLGAQLASLDELLAPFDMASMKCFELKQYPVNWNWKVSLENFTEGYHQTAVHANSIEPYIPARLQKYDDVDGPYNLFWMPTITGKPLLDLFPPCPEIPAAFNETMIVINVFPLFHLLIDAGVIAWLDWEPRSADDHDLRWRILVPETTAQMPDFAVRKLALGELLKEVWDEDVAACAGVNAGVRSRHAAIGRPCFMEKSVHQLQNWLLDQYLRPVEAAQG